MSETEKTTQRNATLAECNAMLQRQQASELMANPGRVYAPGTPEHKMIQDAEGQCRQMVEEAKAYGNSVVEEAKKAAEQIVEESKGVFQAESDSKLLETLRELHGVQGNDPSSDTDEYMRGMYNGMELSLATVEDREPKYKDSPKKTESENYSPADTLGNPPVPNDV